MIHWMKMFCTHLLVLGVVFASSSSVVAQDERGELERAEEQAFKEVAVKVSPSLVKIDTVGGLDVIGKELASTAATTGIIVSDDGYLVSSAFNFISKPSSILVTLPNGDRRPARIVATDRLRMVTLLKVEASGLVPPSVAPKASFKVGQWSIALGRTYDTALPSVSVGIVSAINRVWGKAVQTDAKVSPVNYGGPLCDVQGRVMGVLVPLSPQESSESAGVEWYDSGIGFAVPLEDILDVLDQLKMGTDLRPGLAGVTLRGQDLNSTELLIDRVRFDSPAWNAGLRSGDIVEQADGQTIVRHAQLMQVLKSRLEGETVEIVARRGDEKLTAKLVLAGELLPYESAFLGILPTRNDAADAAGVGIRFVYDDSPASRSGLKIGDRIVELNGEAIASSAQLSDRISRIRPDEQVALVIMRDRNRQKLDVRLSGVPNVIPGELAAALDGPATEKPADAAADKPVADDKAPKTGRFSRKLGGDEREFLMYVPDSYQAGRPMSLLVWLHPTGSSYEATIMRAWKSICDHRGVILVAPKAAAPGRWSPNDVEFVTSIVKQVQEDYSIATERIVAHGFADGALFAALVATRSGETFRGVLMAGSPLREAPPENSPMERRLFHLMIGEKDPVLQFVDRTVTALEKMKIPVTVRKIPDLEHKYPEGDAIDEAGTWLDSLDRI